MNTRDPNTAAINPTIRLSVKANVVAQRKPPNTDVHSRRTHRLCITVLDLLHRPGISGDSAIPDRSLFIVPLPRHALMTEAMPEIVSPVQGHEADLLSSLLDREEH